MRAHALACAFLRAEHGLFLESTMPIAQAENFCACQTQMWGEGSGMSIGSLDCELRSQY